MSCTNYMNHRCAPAQRFGVTFRNVPPGGKQQNNAGSTKKMGSRWHDLCGQSLGAGRFACIQRLAAEFDATLLFIMGWVGGDSGRHSPGRLGLPQGSGAFLSDSSNFSTANLLSGPSPING